MISIIPLVLLWCLRVLALSPSEWSKQSIYQVLTDRFARTDGSTSASCNVNNYCGGTWRGIINKLDYIQGMGFTAVWVSPIVKNLEGSSQDGESYHGFWAQDIWAVNSHFGTADDLVALADALHARGMYLMVDIVTNHMGYLGCGNCVDYSVFNPFSSSSYYHPFCFIDYNSQTSIEQCWQGSNTVSLPDLRTEDSNVRAIWNDWIKQIVAKYKIDGLRIDSMKHQESSFWAPFETSAGVYMVGEVYDGDPNNLVPYLQVSSGVMNYAAYYWITRAFQSTSSTMTELLNGINTMKSKTAKTYLLGSFVENHDQKRLPSLTQDMSLVKNAIAFTHLMDGIPIVYNGQEQFYSGGDVPNNREAIWSSQYSTTSELYKWITSLNKIRSRAIAQDSGYSTWQAVPTSPDSRTIVLRKGNAGAQVVSVFNNIGASGASYSVSLPSSSTGFAASQSLVEVMGCTAATTDSGGTLSFSINGTPKVFYPLAKLTGSGICPSITGGATTATSPATTLTTRTGTATSACATPTAVRVSFNVTVTTSYGQTIKIVGNNVAIGNWDTAKAVALSADSYTTSNPLWTGTISFPSGAALQYKFINVASGGAVTWEADPNRAYTVPAGCAAAATVVNKWQG